MAKQSSSEPWDESEEPQAAVEEREEETSWVPPRRRMAATRSTADWDDEEEADDSGWLDDSLDDVEEAPQGCDEGEVYRLLGRGARRGRDD